MSRLKWITPKYIYYYVRPCPNCGSSCTGRYVKRPLVDAAYVEQESLKNGEIVRFVGVLPERNCFCVDCGFEFRYTVRTRFITKEEQLDEKRNRGTEEAYEELRLENENARAVRQKKVGNRIFNWVFSR